MTTHALGDALIHEHHEIDTGIAAFVSALREGVVERDSLAGVFDALRRHIYLEEELLFPPLRRAGLLMPIMVMTKEHGQLWQSMSAIEEHLGATQPDVARLESECRQLLAGLDRHNMKEEPIVYPHAATDLTSDEAALLARFIETGRTPPGWICEAAR